MVRTKCMAVAAVFMVAVKANQCPSGGESARCTEPNHSVSMLQTKLQMNALEDKVGEELAEALKEDAERGAEVEGALVKAASGGEACTNLLNRHTFFTVKVSVGTPAQTLELVADTGSNAVIVASCVCLKNGVCGDKDHCFIGAHGNSSTYALTTQGGNDDVVFVETEFGSGPVTSVVASDVVEVGGLKATMKDGLLLLVDRKKLNVSGPFEGILGLGRPDATTTSLSQQVDSDQTNDQMQVRSKKFFQEAGVERFSICFSDDATGVLRMNVPKFQNTLPPIGTTHWSFGLYGVSVGSETAPAILCNPSEMKDGQKTPCGALPDSGTTLLTAPKDQVTKLFASLCDSWERCRAARRGKLKDVTAASAFQSLVHQCNEWMTAENGITEIPSIFFAVGSPSNLQNIEVTPWAYIVETKQEEYAQHIDYLKGVVPLDLKQSTGKLSKVCVPRIGAFEYNTDDNGAGWILGTPLFYEYTVGYDMQDSGVNLKNGACTDCTASAALLDSHNQRAQRVRPVRTATEPPHVRKIDTSLPL